MGKYNFKYQNQKPLGQGFLLQESNELEEILEEVENAMVPLVRATEMPGQSKATKLVKISLKSETELVR